LNNSESVAFLPQGEKISLVPENAHIRHLLEIHFCW